ncbi:Putative endonuclease [Echinococcus granulosus]|uniref:Endonuclease n=1 Tax=Echinococcus granulosus TaxID=6210 RepID=W6UH47_ECHGR|nr:Putative endonuclease [Echinococcus granulosus]EUB60346.1 Putative endonuclease [Echinococcus granulosus]
MHWEEWAWCVRNAVSSTDAPQVIPRLAPSLFMEELKKNWIEEQLRLKQQCVLEDSHEILEKLNSGTLLVGGLDISYSKNVPSLAFVGVSVVRISDPVSETQCETLAVDCNRITVEVPYVPNFLAFREVPAYVAAVRAFETHHAALAPDVFMVDSNGTLHPLRFGAACHLGVLLERPTFGVAKNLPLLQPLPNHFPPDADGPTQKRLLLQALLTSASSNPVFVSPGHLITLQTAVEIALRCSIHRIPEPTRKADLRTREELAKFVDAEQVDNGLQT